MKLMGILKRVFHKIFGGKQVMDQKPTLSEQEKLKQEKMAMLGSSHLHGRPQNE